MFTFSGCLTGEGTPLKYCTGRKQTKRSSSCRSATLSERIPPPTGVVNGPLIPTRYSRNASTVSFGSHSSNLSFAVWPANTSNHAIFFFPVYAFSTAASNTRTLAAQISGPVPSPRMNGMIGRSGTFNLSVLVIFSPAGGATSLYGIGRNCSGSRVGCNLAEVVRNQAPREGLSLERIDLKWICSAQEILGKVSRSFSAGILRPQICGARPRLKVNAAPLTLDTSTAHDKTS